MRNAGAAKAQKKCNAAPSIKQFGHPRHSTLIYTVDSLQTKCIVKMSSIFLPVLRHKDFFGWVTSLHGEKMFPIFFDYFNIVYFLKKL